MKRNFVLIAIGTIASASPIATTESPGLDNGYLQRQSQSVPLSISASGCNSTLVTASMFTPQMTGTRDEGDELGTIVGWMPSIENAPTIDFSQYGTVSPTGTAKTISSGNPAIAETATLDRSLSVEISSCSGSSRCSGPRSTAYDTAGDSVGDGTQAVEEITEEENVTEWPSYSTAISTTSSGSDSLPANGTIEETSIKTSSRFRHPSVFAPDGATQTLNSSSSEMDNPLETSMALSDKDCAEPSGTKPSPTIGECGSPNVEPTIVEHGEYGAGTEWKATLSTSNKPPSSTQASGHLTKTSLVTDHAYYGLEKEGDDNQEPGRANEQKDKGYVSAYFIAETLFSPILSITQSTTPNSANGILTETSSTPMNPPWTTILTTHSTAMAPSNGTHGNTNIDSIPFPSNTTNTISLQDPSPPTPSPSLPTPTALTLLYTYPHPTLLCIPLTLPPNSTLQTLSLIHI